jgi:uncharacterized protein (UPF0548 family)
VWSWHRPEPDQVRRFLDVQRGHAWSYLEVGATAGSLPERYDHVHRRTRLGSGAQAFAAARAALREWRFIPAGFARLEPAGAPVHAGEVVAIVLRVLGIWWINATRIAYVIDEPDRFGFAWGTLPDHVVHGEERFCVERTATGDVYYDIVSFSRPGLLARIGAPVARRVRDEFVRGSLAAMAAATARPAS